MGRQVIQKNLVFSVLLKTDLEGLKKEACVCVGGEMSFFPHGVRMQIQERPCAC